MVNISTGPKPTKPKRGFATGGSSGSSTAGAFRGGGGSSSQPKNFTVNLGSTKPVVNLTPVQQTFQISKIAPLGGQITSRQVFVYFVVLDHVDQMIKMVWWRIVQLVFPEELCLLIPL